MTKEGFNMNRKRNVFYGLIVIVSIYEIFSFVFAAIANDVKTYYMGLAYSAKYDEYGEFIGVLRNWELKGFLSRYILWFPHKFASMFFGFETLGYFRMYKLWYAFILLLIVCIIGYLYKKHTGDAVKAITTSFLVLSLFMVTQSTFQMQAEMSAAIMLIFAIALFCLCDSTAAVIVSGVTAGLIFFIKDSFIIMELAVLGSVLYLNKDIKKGFKKLAIAIGGCVGCIVIVLILLWVFYPQEIIDALAVPSMYRTALAGYQLPIRSFLERFFLEACYGAPFIMVGMVMSVVAFIRELRAQNWWKMMGLILLWAAPTFTILLSGRTNVYYYNLYFIAVFAVLYHEINAVNLKDLQFNKKNILSVLICVLWCLAVNTKSFYAIFHNYSQVFWGLPVLIALITLAISIWGNNKLLDIQKHIVWGMMTVIYISSISCISISYWNLKNVEKMNYLSAHEITEEFTAREEEIGEILYLDDGLGLSLLGCKSYSRYFFPIPIQRVDLESETYTGEFKQQLINALDFTGKYVFINEAWFYNYYENNAIREKLEQEYELELTYTKYVYTSSTFCEDDGYISVEYKLLNCKEME
jgi:hypothetical protein